MKGPSPSVVDKFARAFAQKGRGRGMTLKEIFTWFRRYSNNVVEIEGMTKKDAFCHYLKELPPEEQYRALIDLCSNPPDTENELPDEGQRKKLEGKLHSYAFANGLTVQAVNLDPWSIRLEWFKVIGRLETTPDAAITSARVLLEKTCKEVLRQTGASDSELREGDLAKLVKKARKALGLKDGSASITGGIGSVVNGLAELSNRAGDRHGVISPAPVLAAEARLACNMCLSLSLFLLDMSRCRIAPNSNSS